MRTNIEHLFQFTSAARQAAIAVRATAQSVDHSLEWDPSQNGAFALALQPQKYTFLLASAVNFWGAMPLSLWDPSQKGCLAERPQVHQK